MHGYALWNSNMLWCLARFSKLHLQVVLFGNSIPLHFRHRFETKQSSSLSDYTFCVLSFTYKSHLVKHDLVTELNEEKVEHNFELWTNQQLFKPMMRSINYASLRRRQCLNYRQRELLWKCSLFTSWLSLFLVISAKWITIFPSI